jgi:hypothetical protein
MEKSVSQRPAHYVSCHNYSGVLDSIFTGKFTCINYCEKDNYDSFAGFTQTTRPYS